MKKTAVNNTVGSKKVMALGVIVLQACLLCACSSFYASNADKQYLKSKNGNNLVVPVPLTSENISHFYDLPNGGEKEMVSIVPPK